MTAIELALLEQGSDEWAHARCGNVTASRAADVVATIKSGEAAVRRNYRTEIICEILTGEPYPRYKSPEMQWGIDQEPFARAAYEIDRNVMVDVCGFVLHPEVDRFGASPDGLVPDEGMIQIKCPNTSTHISWMLAGTVPLEHMPQMIAEMSCTGREWCDFVSYDPRLPEHLRLFVRRFARDNSFIGAMEREVRKFNKEIDDVLASLPAAPQPIAEILDWPKGDEVEF
jgi:hypothetical protein